MTKTLLLGATGFIGGQIAKAALAAGWEVRGLRRDENSSGHLEGLPVEWVLGDLRDPDSLRDAMAGIEVVFHAAAFYPREGNPRKVREQVAYAKGEIRNVLQAARQSQIGRLVYTSSLTTIGHPPPHSNRLADERDFYIPGTLPKSAYYEAKIAMEAAVLQASAEGLEAVVLNPTAVFGPGDVHMTMGGLLIAAARGLLVGWLPGEINVVDVRDVAEAHIVAARQGRVGERYILGGHNFSIKEALSIATRVAGQKPPKFEIPLWALNGLTFLGDLFPFLPLPSNHLRAAHLWQGYNTTKAEKELGLTPRPFDITVRDSLDWFHERKLL